MEKMLSSEVIERIGDTVFVLVEMTFENELSAALAARKLVDAAKILSPTEQLTCLAGIVVRLTEVEGAEDASEGKT